MKKFLLVDDHVVVRAGIKTLLTDLYKISEIHEADNGEAATALLKENKYDLVILDIQLPKTDSLGLMEYFKIKYPEQKVLVFSMSPENIFAKRFLKAGARGFLNKNAPLEEIKKAIDTILKGKKYLSDSMMDSLAEGNGDRDSNLFNLLSPREFEIVSLLLKGETLSHIAEILNLQVSTVGTHKARIFEKLKVTNILELKELADSYEMS